MSNKPSSSNLPIIIIGVLFFIFGFVTWVNGTLIAFFKKAFGLDNSSSYLVTFAFFISYTVMAIPSAEILKRTGFKRGMSLGLGIMAVGTFIFVPAARMVSYPLFLVGLFTIGLGLTLLQTASNPYVTILGPRESAATRISFMGIANKFAGILGQWIFGGLLLAGSAATLTTEQELAKVEMPYLILTGILVALAVGISRMKDLPEVSEEQDDQPKTATSRDRIFAFPNLILGVIALFLYVGAEVIAGDTLINYGKSIGYTEDAAKLFGTYTLVAMLVGYVLGIVLIPKYVSQQRWLGVSAIIGVLLSVAVVLTSGFNSVLCVALLGFANAIMWPAIWPLAIDGLGKFTKIGSALLIMAIAGGALLPLVYGALADITSIGSTYAYLILVPCYLFIYYYSVRGYKIKQW